MGDWFEMLMLIFIPLAVGTAATIVYSYVMVTYIHPSGTAAIILFIIVAVVVFLGSAMGVVYFIYWLAGRGDEKKPDNYGEKYGTI